MKRLLLFTLVACLGISSCGVESTPAPVPTFVSATPEVKSIHKPALMTSPTVAATEIPATPQPTLTFTPQARSLDPDDWKNWSVIPSYIDPTLQKVYERGLSLGNDPHAFSIFGDCQARPDEFFGVFEEDADLVASLPPELHETVENFRGSFNRESSTAQDGTTPGALIWAQWHRGEYGCTFDETPVECELRTHRPSFVVIQIGSHFESRNTEYLREIILQIMDAGVVPILATKADNREMDERVNRDMALLASEYDLPLWNFWAAVSDLPNRGLYTRDDRPLQGDIYLTEEAEQRHRMTGLEALDIVWRAVTGN